MILIQSLLYYISKS